MSLCTSCSVNMSQHMIFPSILFITVRTLVFVSVILLLFHFDTCKSNVINFPFLAYVFFRILLHSVIR